jgi:hypothetical protein
MFHERLCSHITKDARPARAQTLRRSNLRYAESCLERRKATAHESTQGSALASCTRAPTILASRN